MSDSRFVHVILPIGFDPLFPARRAAIEQGVSRSGLKPRFPDYARDKPEFDLAELKLSLQMAERVVADLSHERPSCYYELGVAEAMGKRVVLIAEAGTPIHQSSVRNAIEYYYSIHEISDIVADILRVHAQ